MLGGLSRASLGECRPATASKNDVRHFIQNRKRLEIVAAMEGCRTHVLNHVAVIADEEDGSAIGQVDLHADQTVGVAGQVVQGDALAEIEAAFVKGLPVPA